MSLLNQIAGRHGLTTMQGDRAAAISRAAGQAALRREQLVDRLLAGGDLRYGRNDSETIRSSAALRFADKAMKDAEASKRLAKFDSDDAKRREVLRHLLLAADHHAAGSQVVKAAAATARVDSTIPMASQALASIYQVVYQIEHAGLTAWDGEMLKINTSMCDPAAENYVWYERDLAGMPKAGSTYDVTTIPMVNGPVAAQNQGFVMPALVGYETNFMEPRRAALARQNNKPDFMVEQGKIEAAKRVIAEFGNALFLYGDKVHQIDGLHTSPLVPTYSSVPGAWSTATDSQINDELRRLWNLIANTTQGRLGDIKKVKMLCPPSQFDRLSRPIITAMGIPGYSLWKQFSESMGIPHGNLVKCHELAAANSAIYTGGPLGLAVDTAYFIYEKGDGWDWQFILSQPIEIPAPPRMTGVGDVTIMHARMGGVMIQDAQRGFKYVGL